MSNKSPFLRHSFHYQFCKYSTKFLSVLFFPFSVLTPLLLKMAKGEAIDWLSRTGVYATAKTLTRLCKIAKPCFNFLLMANREIETTSLTCSKKF